MAMGAMLAASTSLRPADYVVIAGYFVVMLGVGAYFYRRMRRMKDYFSGGNQVPWWLSGASFYMSSFSVFGFIVYSALAYKYGMVAVAVFWSYIPGTLLCAFVFSRRWRRARIDSPIEYLESRFSPAMRQVCAWHGIPVKIIDDALKLVAIGIFFSVSLGLDIHQSILWSGLIMLAYTFMGGLWAVIVTDYLQFVIMTAAVVVLFVLAMARAGGMGAFVEHAAPGSFALVVAEYSWMYIASMVFLYAVSMCSVHWQLIQRFCCVPDEREARKMGVLVAVLQLVTPVIMFVPAMAARQFLGGDIEPRQIYPELCNALLPAGLLGLMIAAMFAATMSMLSSDYNACASVLTNDVYRRLLRPAASERELVLVGRVATVAIGVVALVIAFVMVGLGGEDLFRSMVKLFSVATAPVAIPMVLGLISRRMTALSALSGFAIGLGLGLGLFVLLPDTVVALGVEMKKENLLLFVTAAATYLTMEVVSRWRAADAAERARIKAFGRRLATPIGASPLDQPVVDTEARAAASPFRLVGVCTACIGGLMLLIVPLVERSLAFWLDLGIGVALLLIGWATARMGRPAAQPAAPTGSKVETAPVAS